MQTGRTAALDLTVTDDDTAQAVGSGDLPVLATPRLLAWCEAATCRALAGDLAEGRTSVGTRVALEHLRPTAVGASVRVTADVVHVDGRLFRFAVRAEVGDDLVATGEVTRVVVDADRFMARVR
ncbi:MAG: thioesterase family protein [Actinomycetes bacterium]